MSTLCQQCASRMEEGAIVCVQCGCAASEQEEREPEASEQAERAAPKFLTETDLSGIGGWLILPLVGLAVAPFLSVHAIYTDLKVLYGGRYQAGLSAHPLLAGLVLYEAVTNSIFLVVQLALNLLFYRKKRAFPVWMIAYLAANFLLSLVDHLWAAQFGLTAGWTTTARTFVGAAIWIPYFVLSRRVKLTFVD